MLLAMLTYGRLEIYRNSQISELFFERYMQKDERGYINTAAEELYDSIKKTTKDPQTPKPPVTPKAQASPRISLNMLFDKKLREKSSQEWEQKKLLLKNLIEVLYADAPFYKKIMEERPTFPDDLISALTHTIDNLPEDNKLKNPKDLAELNLADEQLNEALYMILRGGTYKTILDPTKTQKQGKPEDKAESEADQSDSDPKKEVSDYKSPEGHFSLLDFVNQSSYNKIRVYLASKEVLQAIFPDKATVDDIINERKALYKQADAGTSPQDLSNNFKSQFVSRRHGDIEENSLDFTVSKTNPKNYE